MEVTAETPRNERTISGIKVQVPAPYAAGQTIGEPEAHMLNQTLAENFSNNLRERIAKFVPANSPEGTTPREATPEEAQALVDAYAAEYTPGARRGGGGGRVTLSPRDREIRELATQKLLAVLAAKGKKRKEVNFDELRDKIIATHGEALGAAADKIIAARNKASGGLDDDILGSVGNDLAAAEQQEAVE